MISLPRVAAILALSLVTVGAWAPPAAAQDSREERIRFDRGSIGTSVEGRIVGRQSVDYLLDARAGQRIVVTLGTEHAATYFNLIAPSESDMAFYNASIDGNTYVGNLPETGTYRIRVYQMSASARRGEAADYNLSVEVTGGGGGDALVSGTEFNATGQLPCARYAGQPMTRCDFGVIREGNGNGRIVVTWPDGGTRVIGFEMGTPSWYDESQADGGARMTVSRSADLYTVRIGDQRFEIVEAVMTGG